MLSRRECLVSSMAATMAGAARSGQQGRPKIAFLGTVVRNLSHSQHFLDRFAMGYAWAGQWQKPRVELAGVYIDQFPESDLARQRAGKYGIKLKRSVEDALTLGTGTLAVDGVVIIGEHGNYPVNEKGQTLYPRHAWFKRIVKVFEQSGRSVPVFNDKHLSTTWNECAEMVADSKRLKFPFLAGSSLPVTWRMPQADLPLDAPIRESVCVAYGFVDSYDFHAFESAQCFAERRKGGEVGIKSVHALRGANLWKVLDRPDRARTRELFLAALCTSHTLPVESGYPTAPVTWEWLKKTMPDTTGFLVEHRDGFRSASFLTGIRDFTCAVDVAGRDTPFTCLLHLPMPNRGSTTADFFNPLVRHIEEMVLTGKAPYPVERTLLTSGMVIAGVDSLHAGQVPVATPEMAVRYRSVEDAGYARN
ncbi:MAG: hypothetical protein NTZ71_09465 [Planctomycetota bacterium]|nr:hypothetical protein [Planctomycetota bacterium]